MRLQTSNCLDKNAITLRTFIRDNTRPSFPPSVRWGNSRAHLARSLPPNVTLNFTHFVTEKNARIEEEEGGGNTAEFQGRKEINFFGGTKLNI